MKRSIHHPSWKDIIEGILWATGTILFVLSIMWAQSTCAQNIVRKGNTFVQQSSNNPNKIKKDSAVTLTKFTYVIKDVKYPVYKSSKGSYFIVRIKKDGSGTYRQYVTEIIKGTK